MRTVYHSDRFNKKMGANRPHCLKLAELDAAARGAPVRTYRAPEA
jgi:hypothetical protein